MKKINRFALVLLLLCDVGSCASAPSCGDGFLHLGNSGYAYMESEYATDLDYSRDLSVEAVVRIEPHQAGGRWATFIEKGGEFVLSSSSVPGFALGTSEGNSREFGKHIQAKIGDGSNHVAFESPLGYQGYVHAVMTWEAASRTLTLFVNGESAAGGSNDRIAPARIRNGFVLRMGMNNYPLRRNIFLARLWNRKLSASEVSQIWTAFSQTKRHGLPESFDRSALVSEWLMDRLYRPAGSLGPAQIWDNAGNNHLKLAGDAQLISGKGELQMVYPSDGATGVGPSATLAASGGGSLFGDDFVGPLQYCFQIDESALFDSPAMKESGWIAHYGQWKPVLKPGTEYFWRVKVRDSGTPPRQSAFSTVRSMRTRTAVIWYVRPLVDGDDAEDDLGNPVADPGVYGKQDGTSYVNAFNGIAHVKWGPGGVEAGDTLYVCDTHVYHARHSYWAPPVVGYIPESGFSPEYPITIAMDYPDAPGTLCGFFRDERSEVNWVGPDDNGVYRTQDLRYGVAVEALGSGYLWLERATTPTWKGHFGAVYNAPRQNEPWFVDTTYVKMSDGGEPGSRLYSPNEGFRFDLGRSSYVVFANCRFSNSQVLADSNLRTVSEVPPSHHVVLEDCDLGYCYETQIDLREDMDNWTIRRCNIHHAGRGINCMVGHNLLVEDCSIHEIGAPQFPNTDAHAIGVAHGSGHILQHNHLWNVAGSVIEFWSGHLPMENMTICHNFIHDTTGLAATSAGGIVISGENPAPGSRTGFRIYGNIITNTAGGDEFWRGWGISSNSMDPIEIYNNVLYRTYHGIRLVASTPLPGYPVKAKVYNNMIISPRDRYAFVDGSDEPWDELFWDYNLYYPAADVNSLFYFGRDVPRDAHSVLANPRFAADQPQTAEQFKLRSGSPAIDAAIDVGLTVDFAGQSIPQGNGPDIGAFEFSPAPSFGGTPNP